MNGSSIANENIFNSLDLVHVVESLKHAITEGYLSEALKNVLGDTFEVIKKVTRSTGVRLYRVDDNKEFITLEYDNRWEGEARQWKLGEAATFPAHTVTTMKSQNIKQESEETPENAPMEDQFICLPINTLDGDCFSILELFRNPEDEPFSKNDKKIVSTVVGWLCKSICPAVLKRKRRAEEELDVLSERTNIFLNIHRTFLRLCLCSMIDHDSKDSVVEEIKVKMELVGQRARIFLFDKDVDFMWPPELCECYEGQPHSHKWYKWKNKKIIEFTQESDIAWYAVNDKNIINVIDPTSDPRLNRNIDLIYGCYVKNMLSFPIYGNNKVIGAVTIINKLKKPCFTSVDEELCAVMADYFAFILNFIGLSTKNSQKQLEHEISHNMFSYRMEPTCKNIELLVNSDYLKILPEGFLRFTWYPIGYEDQLEQMAYFMMKDVIDEAFTPDRALLAKLILFAKNLYNPNCFHNFEHVVSVLHCIYLIFKQNMDVFRQIEITALAVTALCHDAGQSGLRGKSVSGDVHQNLYDAARGHRNSCERVVGIIKDVGVFEHLQKNEYQELMNLVMHCTNGTDITVSFEKRLRVMELLERDEFDLEEPLHRSHLMVLVMSAADLSGQTKPIDIAMMITSRMYEEFYEKGDVEKSKGLCPTEKMNRDFCDRIPEQQLFYLSNIVKPIYEVIGMCLRNTQPLLNGIEAVIAAEHSHYEELSCYLKTRDI